MLDKMFRKFSVRFRTKCLENSERDFGQYFEEIFREIYQKEYRENSKSVPEKYRYNSRVCGQQNIGIFNRK